MEKQLGKGPYFSGEALSLVDIAWLVLLHRAAIIERHAGYDFLEKFPKMKNWQKSVLTTGLQNLSVSSDFEELFTDFYLSENTYLGHGKNAANLSSDEACKTGSCC